MKKKKNSIKLFWGLPGGPEVRTPCFNCREHGVRSLVGGTKSPHAVKTNKQIQQVVKYNISTQKYV